MAVEGAVRMLNFQCSMKDKFKRCVTTVKH